MKNKYYIMLVVVLFIGGYLVYQVSNKNSSSSLLPGLQSCNEIEKEINELLSNKNYCNEDFDCISVYMGCPFGCFNLINRNENFDDIKKSAKSFFKKCPESICMYSCPSGPEQENIKCINKKCTSFN
jgi:hypothetical protein